MPKSKSSYSLVIKTNGKPEIKLNITSPKVAKEVITQLAGQNLIATATMQTSKIFSTEDK